MNDLEQNIECAAEALHIARRVAVLTGAGISAESGVPTFRASDGLWEGHRVEDVATPRGFKKDPELVWRFYNQRRANLRAVKPNPGHIALVQLEQRFGEAFTLITQNVDGLHQLAGNKNVHTVHGTIHQTRCTGCEEIVTHPLEPLDDLPKCTSCGAMLRPNIVWFEEMLPDDQWMPSLLAAQECDLFLVVGTSAQVYPAAGLMQIAKKAKSPAATVIEFNLNSTAMSDEADICLHGPSGELLPRVLAKLTSL